MSSISTDNGIIRQLNQFPLNADLSIRTNRHPDSIETETSEFQQEKQGGPRNSTDDGIKGVLDPFHKKLLLRFFSISNIIQIWAIRVQLGLNRVLIG
jgi:hypothetical protein